MKNLAALFIIIIYTNSASGQCAVYTSDNGPWGAGFKGDENITYTMDDAKKEGMKNCKDNGGINCHIIYSSYESGWWGLLRGRRNDGRILYEVVYGQSSENTARQNLIKLFARDNGTEPETDRMKTWLVK